MSKPKPEVLNDKANWGPRAAISVTLTIYFLSQIAAGIIIAIYPLIRHWNKVQSANWLNTSETAQFVLVLAVELTTVLLVRAFLKHKHASFRAIGLKRPKWLDIAYALSGFAVYFLLFAVIISLAQAFLPLDFKQKQELGFSTATTGLQLIPVFISLVILPPLVEEILVRGFLYTGLRNGLNKIPAAIIASLLFAAAHLQWGSGSALLWVAAIDTFILSLVLVYLREKTGSLAASIMLHMIKNGLVFVNLFIFHNS